MSQDSTRVELIAIPLVVAILGLIVLVLFAATKGPWAWIVLGIALVVLVVGAIRYASKRYPHMWDEAPADETAPSRPDDGA